MNIDGMLKFTKISTTTTAAAKPLSPKQVGVG